MGGIFGIGQQSYEVPQAPVVESLPVREDTVDPESKASRDTERRKLRARAGGVSGTLLSSPLAPVAPGLLGRIGSGGV